MSPPEVPFVLLTPSEIGLELGRRLEALRLAADWRRATLAERTGLSVSSIQRFERTGKITLEHLLLLAHALGRAEEFASLFRPSPARSLDELEQRLSAPRRQRGRR